MPRQLGSAGLAWDTFERLAWYTVLQWNTSERFERYSVHLREVNLVQCTPQRGLRGTVHTSERLAWERDSTASQGETRFRCC